MKLEPHLELSLKLISEWLVNISDEEFYAEYLQLENKEAINPVYVDELIASFNLEVE